MKVGGQAWRRQHNLSRECVPLLWLCTARNSRHYAHRSRREASCYNGSMWHVSIVALFLLFAASITFVVMAQHRFQMTGLAIFRSFRNAYMAFCFMLLLNLLVGYLVVILNHPLPASVFQRIFPVCQVLMTLSLFAHSYLLADCLFRLLVFPIGKVVPWCFLGACLAVAGVEVLGQLQVWKIQGEPIQALVELVQNLITLILLGVLAGFMVRRGADPATPEEYRRMFSHVGWVFLLGLFVNVGLILAAWRGILPMIAAVLGFILTWGVMNALPVLHFGTMVGLFHQEMSRPGADACQLLKDRHGISDRELEIIQLVVQGRSNKEIADLLFITLQTVKDHNSRIYRKLDVSNRVQLTNLFRSIV